MIIEDLCPSTSTSAELREKLLQLEKDLQLFVQQIPPVDWNDVEQNLQASMEICRNEEKQIQNEYRRLRKQLLNLQRKLLIGQAYYHPPVVPILVKKKKKKKKSPSLEQRWRNGIAAVYRRLQNERDRGVSTQILPPVEVEEHQFVAPLPPPPLIDSVVIPFETPPLTCASPPRECDDRFPSLIDDTIVQPTRRVNRTLNNMTQMSFHIDPEQCSSPKGPKKFKTKTKKKLGLPPLPPAPAPPAFSSTAIFDSHAFFTQPNGKTKKQKKKIDISRQPLIMTMNESEKKSSKRRKKVSPYDFQEEDDDDDDERISLLSIGKGNKKLLTDDLITARFAKNSHFQTHQNSMASVRSQQSSSSSSSKERPKKTTRNILGIGTSSPLTFTGNDENLSPGQLSFNEEEFTSRSTTRFSSMRRQRRKR